jgi:hypothetical protein
LQLSINSHTYIADTAQAARDEFYPPFAEVNRKGKERGVHQLAGRNLMRLPNRKGLY